MYLSNLIKGIDYIKITGNKDINIKGLSASSKKIHSGYIYVAITGTKVDGNLYAIDAKQNGAVCIITDNIDYKLDNITIIYVKNSRTAYGIIAKNLYDKPDEKMIVIGITGTNGKTTTTKLIANLLELQGKKVGIIGTNGYYINDESIGEGLTTPDPEVLYEMLAIMFKRGVSHCIMEISAHSIALEKVSCLDIDIAVFTNFTQDHLDFFKSMEEYESYKIKFMLRNDIDYKVINSDDETGRKINKLLDDDSISYGISNPSDVFAVDIKYSSLGSCFVMNIYDSIYYINSPLYGLFNVYNLLTALTVIEILDIDLDYAISTIPQIKEIEGRFNVMAYKNNYIIIDYAHTPDGLYNLLKGAKVFDRKIITVFGCGGNRDKCKRPIMGRIAKEMSDFVIVTSDNPRYEDPAIIINEIMTGISNKENTLCVVNRIKAIEYAMRLAHNSVIVIAGKGAEQYIEQNGIKVPYNDKNIVQEIMESLS